MSSISERAADLARAQLNDGAARLAVGRSRYGRGGRAYRRLLLRATRHLAVRQTLVDQAIVEALSALAFDTAVAHRGVSSFPGALDPTDVVDVDTEVGPLYLHAGDEVMTPWIADRGNWEPAETEFLRGAVRAGDTMLDIGANLGYMSVLGSALVGVDGSVIAVEPEARNLKLLRANLWRNGCDNVAVLPVAAGPARAFLPLRYSETNRGDHQAGREGTADVLVPSVALDDVLDGRRVDVIKLDTQGFDHEVIAGLDRAIAAHRPKILCEFWVQGMSERRVDPRAVADAYARRFAIQLLDESAQLRQTTPEELVETAAAAPGRFVNVVLSPQTA